MCTGRGTRTAALWAETHRSWDFQASEFSQIGELQVVRDTVSKHKIDNDQKEPQCQSLASMAYAHIFKYIRTTTDMNTHT